MASKRTVLARVSGLSTTGNLHGLLIEADDKAGFSRITITGADGAKRHATVVLESAAIVALLDSVVEATR
jgi:hypothetical protein